MCTEDKPCEEVLDLVELMTTANGEPFSTTLSVPLTRFLKMMAVELHITPEQMMESCILMMVEMGPVLAREWQERSEAPVITRLKESMALNDVGSLLHALIASHTERADRSVS